MPLFFMQVQKLIIKKVSYNGGRVINIVTKAAVKRPKKKYKIMIKLIVVIFLQKGYRKLAFFLSFSKKLQINAKILLLI